MAIIRSTPEYDHLRALPSFTGGRNPSDVRFDPESGKIYYTTWREKRTEIQNGRRVLRLLGKDELPKYEVLLPRKRRNTPGYLENLPLKSPVQELILHHADTIEEAIVKVGRILQAPIRQQAQEVITYVAGLSTRFIEKGLTEESLRELAVKTSQFLEENGLAKPISPRFQKMTERLKKACERDSRGRINNLVSRVRAQAVFVEEIKRLVAGNFVRRKHGENFSVLVYERETTRWAIRSTLRQLSVFLDHAVLEHPEKETNQSQLDIMAKMITNVAAGLGIVRVAPYLAAAREAAINLVGCREEKREANRQILEEKAEELFNLTPVTQLLREGKIQEASARVERSVVILETVLERG